MGLPTVTVIGNLKGIELKYTQSGKALCKFKVECAEKNTKGEWVNLYLNGECWDKQAEFVNQYFQDGSVAIVTGKLFTNVYKDKNDKNVYEVKLLFPSVSFAPKDKADNQSQPQQKEDYRGNGVQQKNPTYEYENVPRDMPSSNNIPVIDIDEDDLEIPF
jgi:single stranded DNA-binding protein